MDKDYAYYKQVFREIEKPFAFLDFDLLDKNIEAVLDNSNGKQIRIATKSLRSIGVIQYIFQSSPQFQGLMCFSPQEAFYLAKQGFTDLLLAYPVYDEFVIKKLLRLSKEYVPITFMVDCYEHVKQLEKLAQSEAVRVPICIDLDMSSVIGSFHFGVRRSPLQTKEQILHIAECIASSPYMYLDGLMGYEAQIAGIGDNNRDHFLRNHIIQRLKKYSTREVMEKRVEVVRELNRKGITYRFFNGGGTGSLHTTTREACITEVTVGSAFYSPTLFDHYKAFSYQPAVGFALEVVRKPALHFYTCLGGGYVASGAVGEDKLPSPYLPEGASLLKTEGAGEVQTPILYKGKEVLQLGYPVFMRHSKAGEICERFTHLVCVSQGKIVDKLTTYRGDGQCFL
ncbi:amino acid deaminase/aldolase [Priestia taiwanensis]|uniref:Amino acid aldolase n=1 Tax=Priestia taiwanensis TaxID=1347902 RepID=A0A917ESC0_9BACI|nr:amino acid deaminase/aldolase [Priestia taiwanensis]MBM7364927.1 D-serine deaminase-like pyridoxal phosphate-dependent protein [Priestia taiwanensis]GGE82511.1 amino acid aldolase [Priestia taiwanensis]